MTSPPPTADPNPAAPPPTSTPEAEAPPRNAESVGAGISSAAANPGTTESRGDQVRQARLSFAAAAQFRDAIAGNQFNINLSQTASVDLGTHELTESGLRALVETFVIPPALTNSDAKVVVLRAAAGYGKLALAVWLLAHRSGFGRVFRLGPEVNVGKLAVDGLSKDAGYVVDDLSSTAAAALTAFDLERLASAFDKLNGRLIITVRPETQFTDGGIGRYVLDVGSRPQPRDVLASHLGFRLGAQATRLLGRPDVAQLIADELPAAAPLQKAADLARLIAEASGQPDQLVAVVQQQLTTFGHNDFTTWFDGLTDLYLKCFAISLAIFNGLPYETVADAGLLLLKKFDVASGTAVATKAVPEAADPFGDSRGTRLHKLRAQVDRAEVSTIYGKVPAEVVRYVDTSFPTRVLQHVWKEHDRARNGLITWLRDLGGHQSQTVRIRAATAVGVLTTFAYDHMRHEVLARWAGSNDFYRREAAAVALVGPAEDDDAGLRKAVHNLVDEWSWGAANQRATAARAYGTAIGLKNPGPALTSLERIAIDDDNEDFDVVQAVCESLTELVAVGGTEIGGRVLNLILKWSVSRKPLHRVVAHLAFMYMAADLVIRRPDGVTWPSLLWFAYDHREHHRVIAELWARSLGSNEYELALTVLDEWAEYVEKDDTARRAFLGLMRTACAYNRVPFRLRGRAQRWLKPDADTKARTTAAELLAVLSQEVHQS
ncbi:hypothetical protein ACIA8G_27730 [Lentzea sp. NPDC051213]|uniref:hypothetical protein n=1 Tax=Lentzea sp. NPDC051213 TaxID=3364126 RepID=UPI0037BAFC63